MNICIVTVYNSENCGSFYQAYALQCVLKKMENQVCFLRREKKGTSHNLLTAINESVKILLHMHPKLALERLCKYIDFENAVSSFQIVKKKSKQFEKIDYFVIGSDTLWNFDDSYFRDKKRLYCGLELGNKKKITYAVSISNTKSQTILNDMEITNGIRQLDAISVRDQYTQEVVFNLLGSKPPIVLDPTLLLDEMEYRPLESPLKLRDYILIYGFKEVTEEIKSALLALKVKWNCKIVSYGKYRKWVDINTRYVPQTFLSYFHYARCVVTDTFHGAVFSIIYKKQFVSYGQHKNKVKDLLQNLSLIDRFMEPGESLEEKLRVVPDYDEVYETLTSQRKESMRFLDANTRRFTNESIF